MFITAKGELFYRINISIMVFIELAKRLKALLLRKTLYRQSILLSYL